MSLSENPPSEFVSLVHNKRDLIIQRVKGRILHIFINVLYITNEMSFLINALIYSGNEAFQEAQR